MNKDKLISKDNGNLNSSSSCSSGGTFGSSIGHMVNYNDGVSMAFPGMGSYQTQLIGTGMGREWESRGGAVGGMGTSYASGSTGTTGTSNTDGETRNVQSEQEMMHFARIIRLYYMVMYHVPLYSCLKLLYAHLNPNNPNKSALYNVIRDLCSKPRTLKQMSRVIIYNAVGQRPALTVNKLPLPTALREYVLSFEP